MLRRIALNIHIYGGLLCFSYLILLGISVLNFNHPFAFTRPRAGETTWTQPIAISALAKADGNTPADAMQRQNNAAILRAMRSFAEPYPTSNGNWTSADTYHAHFVRPGKEYEIDVHTVRPGSMIRVDVIPQNHVVRLSTQRVGWIPTLIMLHKIAGYDNEPLFDLYALFCDLAGLSMLLFALTGVYLWWMRVKNHALGIVFLLASCAYAAGMMLYFAYAPRGSMTLPRPEPDAGHPRFRSERR